MKICIVRHGETEWNRLGIKQGLRDVPLNENGRKQAVRCGKELSFEKWGGIICSTLSRAKETAKIIANQIGEIKVLENELLVERDYGECDSNGGKRNGEDSENLKERANLVLETIVKDFFPNNVIIVSHGEIIGEMLHVGKKTKFHNAAISMVEYDGNKYKIEFINRKTLK